MGAARDGATAHAAHVAKRIEIPTGGGRTVHGHLYSFGDPRAAVVLHGATAVPQRFYAAFAEELSAHGLAVLTYDFRGVGASRCLPLREDPTTMTDWIVDAAAAQGWLSRSYPDVPLLAIGHSFGGQIAAALDAGPAADAIVLVAAQSGDYRKFPPSARARLWLSWRVAVPGLTRALGYLPGWAGFGEDLPAGVAQQFARWCSSPQYVFSEHPELAGKIADYRGRVLALSFTDDTFASREAIEWYLDRFESVSVEHRRLAPSQAGLRSIGHFGLFRPSARRALWPSVAEFLLDAARRAPTPASRSGRSGSTDLQEIIADLSFGR